MDRIILIAQQLSKEGKTPTTALIKARLPKNTPLPMIIQGLKEWKDNPHKAIDIAPEPAPKAAAESESSSFDALLNAKINQATAPLIAQIKELKTELAALQKQLTKEEKTNVFIKELTFECYRNTQYASVEKAINNYFDMLRYNGQILGREFPIAMFAGWFVTRLVCPEEDSLDEVFNSPQVQHALNGLTEAGLLAPKIKTIGEDLNSLESAQNFQPSWQILYTTFLDTCSPLRCGETLAPIPLYRTPEAISNGDRKSAIKWQEEWINCDELQMNGSAVSSAALKELGEVDSKLYYRGINLCKRIQYITKVPTYYYLYRVAGKSLQEEQQRKCPSCGGEWQQPEPLFDIFDFKCDKCQLVSNLSWDFKK